MSSEPANVKTSSRRKKESREVIHFLFRDPRTGKDRVLCGKTSEFWTWERNHLWVCTKESANLVSCMGCLEAAEKIREKVKGVKR